jgi:hypothetical protein
MAGPDDDQEGRELRPLHPLPRGLVELYGLLAVLIVLIPEWMAGGALASFRDGREGEELPMPTGAWQRLPELRLATMGIAELRRLARSQRVAGYAGLSRDRLTARLLKRLKRSRLQGKSL